MVVSAFTAVNVDIWPSALYVNCVVGFASSDGRQPDPEDELLELELPHVTAFSTTVSRRPAASYAKVVIIPAGSVVCDKFPALS